MLQFYKKSKDVLGLNARSFLYTKPFNLKPARRIADDKLLTKKFLERKGIPVPDTFEIIKNRQELYNFDYNILPKSFVVKPNRGFGGDGIKIVFGKKKSGNLVTTRNHEITKEELDVHINDILEGNFSLTHSPDTAFFEQRIINHPDLKLYCYKGVPDIRIIVFNKVPVIAMLRLPTKESNGKANLSMGGVGVGIDIKQGITTHAVVKNKLWGEKSIEYLPNTRIPLRGIKIPHWDEILRLSIKASQSMNLGYAGVDIAIDKELGPMILEVNARPGLSIQNANLSTLRDRLKRISGLKIKTIKRAVNIGKELFGGEIELELEEISGKQILGIIEKVKLTGKNGAEIEADAKIDTGAGVSCLDMDLACKLGFYNAVSHAKEFKVFSEYERDYVEKLSKDKVWKDLRKHEDIVAVQKIHSSHGSSYRMKINIGMEVSGYKFKSRISVMDRKNVEYPVIIGRSDLKNFLIDPSK